MNRKILRNSIPIALSCLAAAGILFDLTDLTAVPAILLALGGILLMFGIGTTLEGTF